MSGSSHRIDVRAPGGGSYPIWVGAGACGQPELLEQVQSRAVWVVTSEPIRRLHAERLAAAEERAARWSWLEVPDGEAAKDVATVASVWQRLLEEGAKRDALILAFGGGSTGDLAGFAAATFLRGVDVLQIPTTLLAQVDSSVGGKTGIDLAAAKNTVGAFCQPIAVAADVDLLQTLSRDEIRAGLIEAIKMAALLDADLFRWFEVELDACLAGEAEALIQVVAGSVRMKADVVEEDPYEAGPRKLLNFGHTFGHAIEAALGYSALSHGDAVGWGLRFALDLAEELASESAADLLQDDLAPRLRALLGRLELPPLPPVDLDRALAALERDKKARETGLTWVLPQRLGRGALVEGVAPQQVRELAADFLARE